MERKTVLIADGSHTSRTLFQLLFKQDYNILEAENGEQALMLFHQYHKGLAAMLLDLHIPLKDGYQVLKEIQACDYPVTVPIIVITADHTTEDAVRALDMGAVDIVVKSFAPQIIKRRVQNSIELNRYKISLEEQVAEQAVRLEESFEVLLGTLSSMIEHRSVETGQHILRIRMFTKILLQDVMRFYPEYGLNDHIIHVIASASPLHDVGKIAIPDTILNKPGKLTDEEFEIMKTHTTKGCEVLAHLKKMDAAEYLSYAYSICRHHHERWDGMGYPDGLRGDEIPLCAQVVGLADTFDALTTDRVYKTAFSPNVAVTMILNGECGAFSPKMLESLKRVREQFSDLAHAYADGWPPQADDRVFHIEPTASRAKAINTMQLGQQKYVAMLRYVNATVVELDMDSGIFHLVYQPNGKLDSLRFSGLFFDAFRAFVARSVHPDDREYALGILKGYLDADVQNGATRQVHRYRILDSASSEYQWYEASISKILLEDEHQHKALVIWKEITDADAATHSAPPSPVRLGNMDLLVGVHQGFNDRALTLDCVNDGFTAMLGYTRQDLEMLFQNRLIELVHPDDRAPLMRHMREQLAASNILELEYRVQTKSGRSLWVLDKCVCFMGADGKERCDGIWMDITQSKEAQEELRLTLERHQIILDQTNDIMFEWDIAKDTISYSTSWKKTFNYDPITEGISNAILTRSHVFPQDAPKFQQIRQEILAGRPYVENTLRLADNNGVYLLVHVRVTPQFDGRQKPVRAIGIIAIDDNEKHK